VRWPTNTGAQNGVRYAYFAQARRLAIELGCRVTIYEACQISLPPDTWLSPVAEQGERRPI